MLNDESDVALSHHMRRSTPTGSPRTPRFINSDSSRSVTTHIPSSILYTNPFDNHLRRLSLDYAQSRHVDMQSGGMRTFTYHTEFAPALYRSAQVPKQHSAPFALHVTKTKAKKNSYPCPKAKQYGCRSYFTTSECARRHAKIHTGKKDFHCPFCKRAFGRKDNMIQHGQTHQNNRSAEGRSDGVKSRL